MRRAGKNSHSEAHERIPTGVRGGEEGCAVLPAGEGIFSEIVDMKGSARCSLRCSSSFRGVFLERKRRPASANAGARQSARRHHQHPSSTSILG